MNLVHFEQLVANGIIEGSQIGLLAASVALIMSVTRRFHVAFIATYMGACYVGIWLEDEIGAPHVLAIVGGILAAGAAGVAMELLYRPVSRRAATLGKDPLIPIFIVSLGITTLVQNLVSIHFNTSSLPFDIFTPKIIDVGDAVITTFALAATLTCIVLVVMLALYLRLTRTGQWIRAVRVNPEMAQSVGISSGMIALLVFAIGSLLSGLLGMMESTYQSATPSMGFDSLFLGFVVAFIAGVASSPIRMLVVAVAIEEVSQLSGLWIGAEWSQVVVFVCLLAYLIRSSLSSNLLVRVRKPKAAPLATATAEGV